MRIARVRDDLLNQEDEAAFGALAAKGGTIYHEVLFNRIVRDTFGTDLSWAVAYDGPRVVGFMPMHTVKSGWQLHTHAGPRHLEVTYGGWAAGGEGAGASVLHERVPTRWNESLEVWSAPLPAVELKRSRRKSLEFRTALVDLERPKEAIWSESLDAKRRNMIRKAGRAGVAIRTGSGGLLAEYYPMLIETNTRAGINVLPKVFYERVLEAYGPRDGACVLIAERGGDVLAGVVLLRNDVFCHYWQGARHEGAGNLGQGELLQWEAIRWAKAQGCRYYDLTGIEEQRLPRIAAFKLGFSRHQVPFELLVRRPFMFRVLNRLERLRP